MIQRISASARGPPLAYIQVCIYGYPLLLSLLPVEGLEATAGGPEPSWAPASPQMTDRALAGSQLAQTASVELLKGFRGYKSKRFIDICFEVN